jgi:hypothetical protein
MQPVREMRAPVEHYELGIAALESVGEPEDETQGYLLAIAHFLAGILRHQMSSTAN